ncbi:MAG: hypothetical protein HFH10_13200 [Dorea sp.]|nr:hypothetical protein [Dorea sp.]
MKAEFFEPGISADTKGFWEGCKEHKLLIQKCDCCGRLRWPAAYICPECLSEKFSYKEMAQEATLYSYITVRKPFHPSVEEKLPYYVIDVELEGGIRMISNLVGAEGKLPKCGDRLRLKWEDYGGYSKPVYELED